MRTDKAILLAIRATAPRPRAPSTMGRALRAWFAPLAWYVADGRTPPSTDPGAVVGHLPRVRLGIQAPERTADAPVLALEACA